MKYYPQGMGSSNSPSGTSIKSYIKLKNRLQKKTELHVVHYQVGYVNGLSMALLRQHQMAITV